MIESYKKVISKEELSEYPLGGYRGVIELIETIDAVDAAVLEIRQETIIGIDTETKPMFKRGQKHAVALLQVATQAKVYLFRLNKIGLPQNLAEVMADAKIRKVGIALKDDFVALRSRTTFEPNHVVDLNTLCQENGFTSIGAKKLAALILGFRISKRQQTSNWEAETLSQAQMEYAATDAWICREIILKLKPTNGHGRIF